MGPSGDHALAVYTFLPVRIGGQVQLLLVLYAHDSRIATCTENLSRNRRIRPQILMSALALIMSALPPASDILVAVTDFRV